VEEVQRLRARVAQLERRLSETEEAGQPAPVTSQTELESTLQAFLKRVGVILQVEKSVVMLYDPETGELVAQKPALGLTDEEVRAFRVRATQGIAGQVFREGHPVVCHDAMQDSRTVKDLVALLKVRNLLTVPLVVERRDEEQQVAERKVIGVFHVFNKRGENGFVEEDIKLLTVLARSAAALISNARLIMELERQRQRWEETFHSILAGVVVASRDGKVELLNSAAHRIFRLSGDGVGRQMDEIIPFDSVRELLTSSLEGGEEMTRELSLAVPDERIFQVQTAILRGDQSGPTRVVATFNDITEIRNVERIKTEFVSSVSHELRTPLTSVKGFVRTLLDDTEGYFDRNTQREFFQIIDQECDRLGRLINDLLNVSRIESGQALKLDPREFDLRELVRKVVLIQNSYTTKHQFRVEAPEEPLTVMADEDKIDQVLTNLLNNAVKYSPAGGQITLSMRDAGDRVEVTVADEGVGIPPEHLDKIFTRFHRVENKGTSHAAGTGIGLYLVKHLLDAHGGKVWVESQVGKGSAFTFALLKTLPEPEKQE
jgi:two-component system phosphate regulon sensor histidine kinase PhoR